MAFVVASFYKFVHLPDYRRLKAPWLDFCRTRSIQGTLLLAEEGINGTLAGRPEALQAFFENVQTDSRFDSLVIKRAEHPKQPFYRLKIKLKKEIVTLGVADLDAASQAGTYVDPKQWNALLDDPEVLLIDTRNDYEVKIGTFPGARNPKTDSFRDFPNYVETALSSEPKDRKIAMFCTGGIRCEKSTAYLRQQGFEQVYHLKGGILGYLEAIPATESRWEGACFVFDNRVAVDQQLKAGTYTQCHGCRAPLSPEDRESPHYRLGIACPHCEGSAPVGSEKFARSHERQRQIELATARGQMHGSFS